MGLARRLLLAAICGGAVTAAALACLYVTTEPKIISLLLEPASMLLMPGLLVSLAVAGAHDFSPLVVILVSLGFYIAFFFLALHLWHGKARRSR